jgi:hypothetical protein
MIKEEKGGGTAAKAIAGGGGGRRSDSGTCNARGFGASPGSARSAAPSVFRPDDPALRQRQVAAGPRGRRRNWRQQQATALPLLLLLLRG